MDKQIGCLLATLSINYSSFLPPFLPPCYFTALITHEVFVTFIFVTTPFQSFNYY